MATSRAKDLADFIAKQSTDDDSILETGALQLPAGTTSERPTAVAGMIRYNSTLGKAEQYDGVSWQTIDTPPIVSSVSPDNFDTAGDTITITGSNFSTDCTVTFINNSGSSFASASLTRNSTSELVATVSSSMVSDDDDPYDIKVTNGSGLASTLENALDFAPEPAFTVASGSLATIYDSARSSVSITTGATSDEADATITYALGSGDSLPAGLSLASSTGTISGTATAVGSNTTTTFDIVATATDGDSNVTTNTRSYSITVNAPTVQSFTSTGSGTFSVPTGVTLVDVLVVGGGGGGGWWWGGGGGAGGLVYRPAFPVTPGGSVSYTIGDGGQGGQTGVGHPAPGGASGERGQNTVFGTLTGYGGGAGSSNNQVSFPLISGGSGGGGARGDTPAQNGSGGQGTQPTQPGDSGTYGFGNPGGTGGSAAPGGGGGGGSGAAGQDSNPSLPNGAGGGVGKQYDISGSQVYYAGGGGAASADAYPAGPGGQGGGGDGGGPQAGSPGTANRGGGGGGAYSDSPQGGDGGSGIVIVKY